MSNQSEINAIAMCAMMGIQTLIDVLCEKGIINEKEFYERCLENSEKIKEKIKEKINGTEK